MNKSKKTLFATIALNLTTLAYASDQKAVEQITVTGVRAELTGNPLPARVAVITNEQIQLSGASNLSQILNAQAGIQLIDKTGVGSRDTEISMRGFGDNAAKNTLVLVDGRRLNTTTLAAPELGSISLKDVERVEIIHGSAGTLYGDQATGGVINIITKQPTDSEAYIETGRGTYDLETYKASYSQGFKNGFAVRVSGKKEVADNYRDNNEANYSNVLTKISYQNSIIDFFIEGQKIEDDLNLAGALSNAEIRTDRKQTTEDGNFSNQVTDLYRVGANITLSDQWNLINEYNWNDKDSIGYLGLDFSSSTNVESFNPRLVGQVPTEYGNALITMGFDIQDSAYIAEYPALSSVSHYTQDLRDVYVQVIHPFATNWTIAIGARNSGIDDMNKISGNTYDDYVVTKQIGFTYMPNEKTKVFLRRDENLRWATADENGFTDDDVEFLKPQTGTSLETGIEWQQQSTTLAALVYKLDLKNEIFYGPIDSISGSRNRNLDDSTRKGLILDAKYQLNSNITIISNYSYVDAEIGGGTFKGNNVPNVAKQTFNFAILWQASDNWSIYADMLYTGNRYLTNDEANAFGELGGHTTYNANIRFNSNNWYSNLRINNIFGKEYNGFDILSGANIPNGYPQPEKTIELNVGYKF